MSFSMINRLFLTMDDFIKEACVGNLKDALAAEQKGADRIELCANLQVGGTTPSEKLITDAMNELKIPIRVMIRPRGGDFVYSSEELAEMTVAIEFCKSIGVEGVVFGVLNDDLSMDIAAISKLLTIAKPLKVVIHKAIDETPNLLETVRELIDIGGVTTILTSGGAATALEGKETLKQMLELAQRKIEIMPAGKVTSENVEALHGFLGSTAYHGKCIVS